MTPEPAQQSTKVESGPTLLDLVANGTMDADMAALLWSVVAEKKSFLIVAEPQKAGKSAVSNAMLDMVPAGTPIHRLTGAIEETREVAKRPDGGYLVIGEFSEEPPAHYIWGEPVREVLQAAGAGFSLTTTMHAADVEGTFDQICYGNGISDSDAAMFEYFVLIRLMGDKDDYWRRVLEIREVTGVVDGAPITRLIYRWNESPDTFARVASPTLLNTGSGEIARKALLIRDAVAAGATGHAMAERLRGG